MNLRLSQILIDATFAAGGRSYERREWLRRFNLLYDRTMEIYRDGNIVPL